MRTHGGWGTARDVLPMPACPVTSHPKDVEAIQRVPSVARILSVVTEVTGMGFAAVARVTEDRWVACAVRDNIAFGMEPGAELVVESTLCHEVRRDDRRVVIDHVARDGVYQDHDLRTPLGAMRSAISLLLQVAQDPQQVQRIAALASRSVERMARLVSDIMDFARGQLGDGIPVRLVDGPLTPTLVQVFEELEQLHPRVPLRCDLDLGERVRCDPERIGQALSNLLANAIEHGDPARPITVEAAVVEGEVRLSVANAGPPLDPEVRRQLFHPFQRGRADRAAQGLGLGLFIAMEIARAHRGTIDVISHAERTRFTLRFPVG